MELAEKLVELRKSTGMNRRQFSDYFGIPYRTVQDWELGNRHMPDYLFRLMVYRVEMEKSQGKQASVGGKRPFDPNIIMIKTQKTPQRQVFSPVTAVFFCEWKLLIGERDEAISHGTSGRADSAWEDPARSFCPQCSWCGRK